MPQAFSTHRLMGTGLICFGLLVYEILSTRLLSVVLGGGNLAIFAIAFAMLGMGAATSVMSLGEWSEPNARRDRYLGWIAALLGLSYLVAFFLVTLMGGYINTALDNAIEVGGLKALVETIRGNLFEKMVWVGSCLLVPYFFFGTFIAILFRFSSVSDFHRLYSADLIGAAFGCILAVVSLNYLGYAGSLGLILVSSFVGGVAFSSPDSRLATLLNAGLAVTVALALMSPTFVSYVEPHPAINELSRNYDKAYKVEQKWHIWNAHSRVAYLSMTHKESGDTKAVYAHQAGDGWANVPRPGRYSLTDLATMFEPKRVLVLFAGVGADMVEIHRQCSGECEIVGVEINRHMTDHALSGGFPGLEDFLAKPGVELHIAEAREFLERDSSRYDAILLSWWGAGTSQYVGTSGLLAQYLYTKEAFESLLDHLTPDGTIIIYNGSKAKILITFRQIFEERGSSDLRDRVLIVRRKGGPAAHLTGPGFYDLLENMRMVLKPSGFDARETSVAKAAAEALGAEVVLSPEGVLPTYGVYLDIVRGGDVEAINRDLIAGEHIELSVVTDDRPFLNHLVPRSYYLDPSQWFDSADGSANWLIMRVYFGFILFLSFMACLMIVGPLCLRSGPELSVSNIVKLFYFFAVGAGFMLVEVALVRKLGLVLGHPTYAISIVLAALIFSTGVGSLCSHRLFESGILTERRTAAMIVCYVLLGAVLYDPLVKDVIVFPIVVKAALIIVGLFPLGFLMGQLFPRGLVWAGREDDRLVPWAWAINGTASTVFVGAGFLLSYPFGFNSLLYLGAAIYAVIIILPLKEMQRRPSVEAVGMAT